MRADALQSYCSVLQVPDERVKRADSLQGYHLVEDLPASQLKMPTREHYDVLLTAFGSALDLTISYQDFPLLEIRAGIVTRDIAVSLVDLLGRPDGAILTLDLQLNKAEMLRDLRNQDGSREWILYLFSENVERLFESPLPQIDTELFTERHRPTTIVVSDSNYFYEGRLLTVVGEDRVTQLHQVPIGSRMVERIDRFLAYPLESSSWVGFQFRHVTPAHLLGQWVAPGNDLLKQRLSRSLLHLCILYTANRAVYNDPNGEFRVEYVGSERSVTLTLSDVNLSNVSAAVLPRLELWLFSAGNDRLNIFQNVTARELGSEDPPPNCQRFADRLRYLFDEARWHYRRFLDRRINAHFKEVQKVIVYVAEAAKGLSEAIDSVTKGFTDTLLATVGVIVVSVLAALIENKASSEIFKISLRVYSGYLVFYVIYRMGSTIHSYLLLSKDASNRLSEYAAVLGKTKVDTLARPLRRRRVQFHCWFWFTVSTYLALAVTIWLASTRAPQFLVERGVIKPATQVVPESKADSSNRAENQRRQNGANGTTDR